MDKLYKSGIRNRIGALICCGATAIAVVVIGCGGGGSDTSSMTGLTTSTTSGGLTTSTTSTTSGTTGTNTTTAGSTAGTTFPAGYLPNNVIFYDDVSQAGSSAGFQVNYVNPDGSGGALFATVPAVISALVPNPSVTNQVVFAAVDPNNASGNYGIFRNSTPSLTNATTIVPGSYVGVDTVNVTPDGKTVVFAGQDAVGGSNVYSVSINGGTPAQIDSGDTPSLDPTGTYVAYVKQGSGANQGLEVFTKPLAGGSVVQLTSFTQTTDGSNNITYYDADSPQFSRTGKQLVFSILSSGASTGWANLAVVNSDGTGYSQITSDTTQAQYGPSFSPDGSLVSYAMIALGADQTIDGVYKAASNGSTPGGSGVAPTEVVAVPTPEATYWTGNNGRSSPSRLLRLLLRKQIKQMHAKTRAKSTTASG